jgi:hypothetical protein
MATVLVVMKEGPDQKQAGPVVPKMFDKSTPMAKKRVFTQGKPAKTPEI